MSSANLATASVAARGRSISCSIYPREHRQLADSRRESPLWSPIPKLSPHLGSAAPRGRARSRILSIPQLRAGARNSRRQREMREHARRESNPQPADLEACAPPPPGADTRGQTRTFRPRHRRNRSAGAELDGRTRSLAGPVTAKNAAPSASAGSSTTTTARPDGQPPLSTSSSSSRQAELCTLVNWVVPASTLVTAPSRIILFPLTECTPRRRRSSITLASLV
jgi:hypothetical protein